MHDTEPEHVANARPDRPWLNRTVLGAGITSGLADFSYETTQVILPGFLAALGVPAVYLGLMEGLADAVASFMKLGSGYIADRLGIRKPLVVIGYALTPIGQALIALAAGWPLILCGRLVSWFGKGLRGPLRDTIIAEAITPDTRGRAFGFHRAMDTVGAVVGPTLGVLLLGWSESWLGEGDAARPFRLVIWCTLIPGVLAALAFMWLVQDDRTLPNKVLRFWSSLAQFPVSFRRLLAAVGIFGAGDFSHTLLILGATQLLEPQLGVVRAAQIAGLLYVLRNIVQVAASYPVGALADRVGHRGVLLAGYVLGVLVAGAMAAVFAADAVSVMLLVGIFIVAGLYVAVQDALEPSLVAAFVPESVRSTGFGALGAVNGVGKLVSSVAVGMLWTSVSPAVGFAWGALLMAAGTLALVFVPSGD